MARNRGVSEATVLSDYGRGGLLIGRSATFRNSPTRPGELGWPDTWAEAKPGEARYGCPVIPIRDTIRSRTAPVVTVALIIVNVLVFLHEIALGPYVERFVHAYGLIPRRLVYWPGDPLDPLGELARKHQG